MKRFLCFLGLLAFLCFPIGVESEPSNPAITNMPSWEVDGFNWSDFADVPSCDMTLIEHALYNPQWAMSLDHTIIYAERWCLDREGEFQLEKYTKIDGTVENSWVIINLDTNEIVREFNAI